jgi:hypothetical protein
MVPEFVMIGEREMARAGSKRQVAIDIMATNADKPMADVLPLIAEANGITISAARSYYVWIVKNTDTPGIIETKTKTVRAPKEKVVKVKTKKEAVAKIKEGIPSSKEEKPVETKSAEEIERIKAANLERIKEVAKKFKKEKEVEKENEVEENYEQPLDSFAAPAFLTRKEVEILV